MGESAQRSTRGSLLEKEIGTRRQRVANWFQSLRDEVRAHCETLEDLHETGPLADRAPGRFEVRTTVRRGTGDPGGGIMSVMRDGRVFEKVGVNVSTVHGRLDSRMLTSLTARRDISGLKQDPRFWASGISLVAHMNSPRVPAVHMNTRMFWTPVATWFGGGIDLNPVLENPDDTNRFHRALQEICERHDPDYYAQFKDWADRYFWIPHRQEARGAGGIFFDDLDSGDGDADFAFVQSVGRVFGEVWLPIAEQRRCEAWTEAEREIQLIARGRYAEFNLLYDRGTRFGLESGHDVDAVLMSMPPVARWR